MQIDFLTPNEGEEQIQTPEIAESKDEVIDLLNGSEDSKPEEVVIDLLNTNDNDLSNNSNSNSSIVDYTSILEKLMEKGTIVDLPENFNNDADRGPVTQEELEEVISYNNSIKEQTVADSTVQAVLTKMSPELQRAYQYEVSGGNPADYLKVIVETQDIRSLNPEDEIDQEKIVREFYKNTGLDTDEIKEKITDLKDANLLAKEATKLKPKLDKRAEEIASDKLESQKMIDAQKRSLNQSAANRVTEKLVKGFEGLKFNANEAGEMLNNIMVEQDFMYGQNDTQSKTTLEYLVDYHKYSKDGDPSRIIKALMVLDPSGKYDDKFNKLIKNQVVDDFVNQHNKDNKNKFNVKGPASTAIPVKKVSKFEFK